MSQTIASAVTQKIGDTTVKITAEGPYYVIVRQTANGAITHREVIEETPEDRLEAAARWVIEHTK